MNVTPGIILTATEDVTHTKLNLLGTPVVALEDADIQQVVDETATVYGDGVARLNKFTNPALDVWTRGNTPASLLVGVRTFRADDWFARCNATATLLPTYGRTANVQQQDFLFAALLTGNTGAGSVDFGQQIPARIAAALRPKITISFAIENGTGLAITPQVRLDTCNTLEDYATVTNRAAMNTASAAPSGALTEFSVTLDTSGYLAALRNGALIYIRFASGSLDNVAKTIKVFPLKLEIGDTSTVNFVERDGPAAANESVLERHFLVNGEFRAEYWARTSAVCVEDIENYAARGWWARPSDGSTLAYDRDTNVPNGLTVYSAKLTGSVATTGTVDFGQDIRAAAAALLGRQVTFSAYLYNGTGADFQPLIRLDTPGTADDFAAPTNRENQALGNCPAGVWTRVSFAFNGADYTNVANGLRLYIRIPSPIMNTGGKVVRIAQCALELGANVTTFDPAPAIEIATLQHGNQATNLVVQTTGTSALSIAADVLTLRGVDGSFATVSAVSLAGISVAVSGAGGLDTGAEAASTWYTVWVISNGITLAGLLSLSTTAPTLPAGYRWMARVGYVRNDASSNYVTFWQTGSRVAANSAVVFTAVGGAVANTYQTPLANVWTATSYALNDIVWHTGTQFYYVANSSTIGTDVPGVSGKWTVQAESPLQKLVPPAARVVIGDIGLVNTSATQHLAVAATSAGLGQVRVICPILAGSNLINGMYSVAPFRVPLQTSQVLWWKSEITGANVQMDVTGYEL